MHHHDSVGPLADEVYRAIDYGALSVDEGQSERVTLSQEALEHRHVAACTVI